MATAVVEERQLLKTLRWWDGFTIALANPGFLLGSLLAAYGALGVIGATVLWGIAAAMSLLNVWVYSELAMMFPGRSGGISLYANEAWRKYTTLVGPIATFGYWIGWSVVLAIFGNIIGSLIQAQWFSSSTWTAYDGVVHLQLFNFIGIGCIVLVWIFNIFGIRLFAWFTYVTGVLMIIPLLVLMFGGFVSGHWHSSNVHWALASSQWGGVKIALVWLFIMMWSSNGIEVCATFTPEYKSRNDSTIALRTAGSFSLLVFILLPLGLGGVTGIPGTTAILANSSYVTAMNLIVGHAVTDVLLVFLILSFLLSMSSSTADAGRALYGISKAGLTVKWLGRLNRFHVPGNAMTVDLVVNTCLILFISSNLAILYMSNIGYVLCQRVCAQRLPAAAQGPTELAATPQTQRCVGGNRWFPDALLHSDPRRRRGLAGAERLRFVDRLRHRRRSPCCIRAACSSTAASSRTRKASTGARTRPRCPREQTETPSCRSAGRPRRRPLRCPWGAKLARRLAPP